MTSRPRLSRRQLFQLFGAVALGAALAALLRGRWHKPALLVAKQEAPSRWLASLRGHWRAQQHSSADELLQRLQAKSAAALIGDGWLPQLDPGRLADLGDGAAGTALNHRAHALLRAHGLSQRRALPWAQGSWLMVVRSDRALARRLEHEGWTVLLDPALAGQWLLPASPRLLCAFAALAVGGDPNGPDPLAQPGLPEALQALSQAALAFHDRDGLTQLINGRGRIALAPSWSVLPLLRRDQRLQAVFPSRGNLLLWKVLVATLPPASSSSVLASEAGAPATAAFSATALGSLTQMPEGVLQKHLLRHGWISPAPRALLSGALAGLGERDLLLPPPASLASSVSLHPLDSLPAKRWRDLWQQTLASTGLGAASA
ncbi:MAG: hypothetical protein ERJ69_02390 [Aphanocapsa feldmannii 288cV]|nr:MAG: hypothetical protein ERJ69_02390 [Aphanocapsa feldmannii 288cV]